MIDELVRTRQLLTEAADRPVFALTDTDLVTVLDHAQAIAACAHALQTQALAEIHGRALPLAQGATSTTVWLREHQRVSPGAAARQVQLAKTLPAWPALAAAMAAGQVNPEQAHVIAAALADLPTNLDPVLKAEAEAAMVHAAATLHPAQLKVVGAHLLSRIDPDRATLVKWVLAQ